MSKKCQELASGLLWVNSERKDGGREEGDSVLRKPLLLNHFLYPPNYSLPSFVPKSPPPPRSGSFCISLPNCLFSSLKLLLPTPWPSWAPYCISYIIPLMERWRMYSQRKIIIIYKLSNSPFFVCFVFPQVIFLSAKMFECLNRCLCLKYCTCAIEGDSQRWRLFLLFSRRWTCFNHRSDYWSPPDL